MLEAVAHTTSSLRGGCDHVDAQQQCRGSAWVADRDEGKKEEDERRRSGRDICVAMSSLRGIKAEMGNDAWASQGRMSIAGGGLHLAVIIRFKTNLFH